MEIMKQLIEELKNKQLTIGSCESFTAGLFCASMASIPGASAVLKGGIVTYATEVKTDVVHVDKSIIDKHGVISPECAKEMAVCAKKMLDVDICVSFTGNAGPDAMEGKPAGLIYCSLVYHEEVFTYCLQLEKKRNELREYAVKYICEKVLEILKQ